MRDARVEWLVCADTDGDEYVLRGWVEDHGMEEKGVDHVEAANDTTMRRSEMR